MSGKELRLNLLRVELEDLKKDYKSVEKNLRLELDGAIQNKLRAKLGAIEDEIDAKEKDIKAIQQDLLQESVTCFTSVLERHPDQLDDMQASYRWVLRQRSWLHRSQSESVDCIIQELLRIPQGQSTHPAIAQFAAHLVTTTDKTSLIREVQDWGAQYINESWSDLVQRVASSVASSGGDRHETDNTNPMHPALLIQIDRSDEASTQSETDDYYHIRAWVVPDIHQYKAYQQGIQAIHLPAMTGDETYALSTLPTTLPDLICQFLTESHDLLKDDPELHIFVPLDLINQDIDRWCLNDFGRPEPMGHQYKVVLRCTERLRRSYRQKNRWSKKWTHSQSLLQQGAANVFVAADDNDLDELFYELDEVDETVVGVQLIQAPSCVGVDSLFGILLQVGMPLAIWSRENLTSVVNQSELSRILNTCCLERLPHTVKDERRAARRHAKDAHIGHHLSLLWDDPHLVPPKSA